MNTKGNKLFKDEPYEQVEFNDEFNQAAVEKMVEMQEIYDQIKKNDQNNFILNKLSKVDSDYDYENATDENVFKTSTEM